MHNLKMNIQEFSIRRLFIPLLTCTRNATISRSRSRHIAGSVEEWPLRRIKVVTGGFNYKYLPMGCTFKSVFVDTGAHDRNAPVILLLHDNPGSHQQLGSFINSFHNLGARVIAANYPGNRYTKGVSSYDDIAFNYSTFERSFVIDSIITDLKIDRVDGVVAHGYGALPALQLLISASRVYRSALFLDFPGLSPSSFAVSPFLVSLVSTLWQSNFLLRAVTRSLLKVLNVNARFDAPPASVDEAAYSILSHANTDFRTLASEQAHDLSAMRSPLMLVSSAWDERVRESSFSVGCPLPEERPGCLTTMPTPVLPMEGERRRHHFFADCSRRQLVTEAFFTDRVAKLFLKLFVDQRGGGGH